MERAAKSLGHPMAGFADQSSNVTHMSAEQSQSMQDDGEGSASLNPADDSAASVEMSMEMTMDS